jgi:hypothetical protein
MQDIPKHSALQLILLHRWTIALGPRAYANALARQAVYTTEVTKQSQRGVSSIYPKALR